MNATKATMAKVSRLVPPRAALLLGECHKLVTERLGAILKLLLDKADDNFFELANKADTSQRQQIYFDAMREVRIKRPQMEREFFANLRGEFERCMGPLPSRGQAAPVSEVGFELALVGTDDVEESLAITNFVESLKVRCKQDLFGFDQRIGHLLSDPQLTNSKNPFGPAALGAALGAIGQHLETNIEARLTLYKLTERATGASLHELYRSLNDLLIREDVLPRLTTGFQRAAGGGSRTRLIIETEHGSEEVLGQDVFSTLRQLMRPGGVSAGVNSTARGHHGGPGFGGAPAGGTGGSLGSAGTAGSGHGYPSLDALGDRPANRLPMSTGSFVSALTQWQHGVPSEFSRALEVAQGQAANLNILRTLRASGAVGALNQTDNLTLDIVTLLFDYILDDPTIPDKIKALIGRLQIPMLKVALLDKDLFSKKTHPARQLLDALAAATVGWRDGTQHGEALYEKIQYIVYRVVEEFDHDLRLFTQLLGELNSFLTEDARQTARQAELAANSLRTQERIVMAKLAVDEAVKQRMQKDEVREFVQQFVRDFWRQLLIVTHVEAGPTSDAWHEQLTVIDDLVWSVQQKSTPDEKRELTTRLPKMLKTLKAGMRELGMEPAHCSKFMTMLASVHVVSVKNVEEATLAERRIKQRDAEVCETKAVHNEEEFVKQALERLLTRKSIDVAELDIDLSAFEAEIAAESVDEPLPVDDQYLEQVMTLDLGDWLEFIDQEASTVRARFTWLSPATGRYLFTDRQGRKLFDLSLNHLVEQFRHSAVKRLPSESDPLFERAIGELMERLEQPGA